ncbi:hypothetical protein WR25_16301 [Diploscapter pachys]|uniref:Uncharacterized protein n=1 Tax=Diploscapter pachys TaxID=2018661 RepID=A0A2A2KIJ7_9BILA|nr:hypothetical protein WR25_16301 [Diploscapter pachys]
MEGMRKTPESGDKKGAVDPNKFSKSAARALSQIIRDSRIVPKDKKMALKVRQIVYLQGKSREERLQQVLDLVKPELTKKADGDDKKLEADLKKAEKKAKKLIRVHDNVFKLIERPELSQATKDAVNELMALLWPKEGDDLEEFQDTNVKTVIKKIKKLDLTELNKLHEEYNIKSIGFEPNNQSWLDYSVQGTEVILSGDIKPVIDAISGLDINEINSPMLEYQVKRQDIMNS